MEKKDTNQLLLAFYGDDFTGSTDAMESLAASGYRTILFTEVPSQDILNRFHDLQCLGVAGTSRAKVPEEMEKELRPIYDRLSKFQPKIVHYKTCSTFDSSPHVGSIGHAIRVALDYFQTSHAVPLLVAAPELGRYTLFGQHFARVGEAVYRLDRHPVMSRHPVTPMDEADLRRHLYKQINASIGLMDVAVLNQKENDVVEKYQQMVPNYDILLFDALTNEHMKTIGKLIWEASHHHSHFVVGSSGVGYALTSYWRVLGIPKFGSSQVNSPNAYAKDNILVVSGSCSMITQEQIENALSYGFHEINISIDRLTNNELLNTLSYEIVDLLDAGKNVILYTALGPSDTAIDATKGHLEDKGISPKDQGEYIGKQLGRLTNDVIRKSHIRRVVLAGGDTSGFITRELGIYGLEMIQQVSPGAPLCRAYSDDSKMDGIELALKGGQLGRSHYFIDILKVKTEFGNGRT